jgi:hypothetical protein
MDPLPAVAAPARFCSVLDEDVSLAAALDDDELALARRAATAPMLELPSGIAPLDRWPRADPEALGVLVLDGLLARDVVVDRRRATELLGPGDLLRPWDRPDAPLVPYEIRWMAISYMRLALLDGDFAGRMRAWPSITAGLLERASRRADSLAVLQGLVSQRRLDVRLRLVLWHLAERWGHVEPDGVRLRMPLTHRLLAQLTGARRQSVSTAISRLAREGLVRRDEHGWLIAHPAWPADELPDLSGAPPARATARSR